MIGNTHYQAVLLAEESVMNRGKRGENRLWKRVTPSVTEFAWLPPNLAESFCKNALYREEVRTYCAFDTPHLGLDTKKFVADVFVENILFLGDTRSADDLSVFTKMAPERLCLGCGWVGGWGPRYLVHKRERGPVRVPSSLTEDEPKPSVDVFVLEP